MLDNLNAIFIWRRGFERIETINFTTLVLINLCAALLTAFAVRVKGARRTLPFVVVILVMTCAASFAASYYARFDISFAPLALTIFLTFLVIQMWCAWRLDHRLTLDLDRLIKRNQIIVKSKPLDAGLRLLQMMLKCDEAIVYCFDAHDRLVPVARLRNDADAKIGVVANLSNTNTQETNRNWRENVQLCEQATRDKELKISNAASSVDTNEKSSRVALPLRHEGRITGALFVRLPHGFDLEDKPLLEAVSTQLTRDLHHDEFQSASQTSRLPALLSVRAAQRRLTTFSLMSGKLTEASFPAYAMDAAVDGYAIASFDGQIAYINRAMRGFADVDAASVSKLDLFQLLNRFRSGVFDEPIIAVQRVLQTGDAYEREIYYAERNQTLAICIRLVTATGENAAHNSTTNAPLCLVITLRDVSNAKEHERLKSDMVSLMSHELRTPITSINGFAELLAGDETLPEDAREFLGIIRNESQRLARMIDNFLAVTRLEQSDKRHGSKVPLLLDEVVRDTIAQMSPQARRKRIRLVEQSSAKLPPVIADRSLVTQVVQNLVDNAIRYSPERTTVAVGAELEAETVRVHVEDRGYGIPPEALDRVWEKFYRVVRDGETKDEESTGLGLSFVREVVEQHGGEVNVASQLGRGSRFTFTLPRL